MDFGGGSLRRLAPVLLWALLGASCGVLPQDTGPRDTGPREPQVASDTAAVPDAFTVSLLLPITSDGYGEGQAELHLLAQGAPVCTWTGRTTGNLELELLTSDCTDPVAAWATRLRVVEGAAELAVPVWPTGEQWVAAGPASTSDGVLVVEPHYALDLQALRPPG